jgi:addiction module HigA family antidote
MEKLRNIHPGEVLNEEFLLPLGISAYRLAKETFIPQTRVIEIIKGTEELLLILHFVYPNFLETVPDFGLACKMTTTWRKK